MPQELRERLATSADASGRSLNREIVDRLERSFEREAARSEGRVRHHMPRRYRRPAFALGLVAATAVLVAAVAGVSHGTFSAAKSPKLGHDPDAAAVSRKGTNRSIPGSASHEQLVPDSLAAQEVADRAYPATSLPFSVQKAAAADFTNSIVPRGFFDSSGGWKLVGPTTATYPGVLNRTSGDYVASGRITALAMAGTCVPGNCQFWVAAAGGGIWRTDDALATTPSWTFVSGSFGTNAIGTLTYDAAHNTLYAGTGEPNASGDSEAGVGIYKSTDGGTTWSLLPGSPAVTNARSISSIVVDPSNANTLYVGTARGVRGVSAVTGGAISLAPDAPALGLYTTTDGGSTFKLIWDAHGSARGVNHVELDSAHHTIYAASFQQGIWRSSNNGASWEQVFATQDAAQNTARTEFALATTPDGHTRIYVGDGGTETGGLNSNGAPNSNTGFYRADSIDAKTAASLTNGTTNPGYTSFTSADRSTPGYATWDYCSGQCWYDNYVVSPPGYPDTVYVGGSYDYNFVNSRSNGKGVLLSTDAGAHFTDQTMATGYVDGIHPDQHALVTLPSNPLEFWEGSDGGLMRSSGTLVNASNDCNSRNLSPASLAGCQSLLAAIPTGLTSLNTGLSTLQFQSVSLNPHDADRPAGRHAGQRDVGGHDDQPELAADDVRRRRPVRLRRRQAERPVQQLLLAVHGRELPERRSDRLGDHLGQPVRPEHGRPEGGDRVLRAGDRRPGGLGHAVLRRAARLADARQRRRSGLPRGELPRVHDVRRSARLR